MRLHELKNTESENNWIRSLLIFFLFNFFYLNCLSSVVNFTETKISYEMLLTVNNYWMDWLQFSARIPACSQRMNPNYFTDALTLLMWPYHEVNICDI